MKKIHGIMVRTYGNEKTHLTLTGKAAQYYNGTDDLTIYEHEYEDAEGYPAYTYLTSWTNDREMEEAELIEMLEALYDEAEAENEEDDQ